MKQTAEAIIDEKGHVHLLESIETSLLAEKNLAEEWLKPEEDQAWSHIQMINVLQRAHGENSGA